jgi:hypothetical protein
MARQHPDRRSFMQIPENGSEDVGHEVGVQPHPWMEFAGIFKDDPWIGDWVQSMAEYRRLVEDDPNR